MKTYKRSPAKSLIGLILVFSFSHVIHAQEKIFIAQGKIDFVSNAPLEIIKASSSKIKGIIDPSTNQFAFTVDIHSFTGFNGGLQQEHFNEKYMESEKYPTASFQGKIIELVDFSTDGVYEVRAKGDLTIHGKKQTRIIKGKIEIRNKVVRIEAKFVVPLTDHNITIPSIINQKIATEIEVSINASTK